MTSFNLKWTAVKRTTIALSLTLAAPSAWSDEAVLYEEALPADAVFLRVLSDRADPSAPVSFAGKEVLIDADLFDTYVPISAAQLDDVTAGAYYTLTVGPSGSLIIEEPERETAAKVHLILLNTGPDAVRLSAPAHDLEVIAALEPGHAASRAVNPIEVTLTVERIADGTHLGRFDVRLSRGQNLTFVAGETSARMIENRMSKTLVLN